MANFIFIHGGSHGSWCWRSLISELKLLGHQAFAFDLARCLASKLGGGLEKIEAGHDVMLSRPRELAQLLTKMA